VTVRVTGVKEAEAALEWNADAITEALARVVVEVAEAVKDEARRQVPVDTGKLRDAIGVQVDGDTAEVFVASDVHYAQFVEFGTSRRHATPFMGPAAEVERGNIEGRVEQAVKDAADG